MQTNYQHIIKNKTDKELERIAKGSTLHSAEERFFVIEQLEKRGIEWEETPLSPSLATLKRNLEKNIKATQKEKKRVAAKKQEEWTGEPMTFWEGVRDMTPMKVLKVLYYQGFLLTKRFSLNWSIYGPFMVIGLPPLFFFVVLERYVFDFELPLPMVIGSLIVVGGALYFLLDYSGKAKKIYEEKPTVFNNHRYSGYFFWIVMGAQHLVMILLLFYLAAR